MNGIKNLDELKKQYGKGAIIEIKIDVSNSDVAVGYFLHPSKSKKRHFIYSRVLSFWRKDEVLDAGAIIVNECFLGGDDRFKNPDEMVHISACQELTSYVDFLSATSQII